jgi:hypothetical protein
MIEPPSRAVRDYLAGFRIACVYVTGSGRIGVATPCGLGRAGPIARAWWSRDRATAEQVLIAVGETYPVSVEAAVAEVMAAAGRLDVVLSEHAVVLARAEAAVAKITTGLNQAKAAGDLKLFNRAYHAYRLEAQRRGEHPMTYGIAFERLRKALASAAAGVPVAGLMQQVFDG